MTGELERRLRAVEERTDQSIFLLNDVWERLNKIEVEVETRLSMIVLALTEIGEWKKRHDMTRPSPE